MKTSTAWGILCLFSSVYATPASLNEGRVYSVDGGSYLTKVEERNNTLEARQSSCTFQAFSGNSCDGNVCDDTAGNTDGLSSTPRCILSQGRHSYLLSSGCGYVDISIYTETGCTGSGGAAYEGLGPGCYNVNTGGNWASTAATYYS